MSSPENFPQPPHPGGYSSSGEQQGQYGSQPEQIQPGYGQYAQGQSYGQGQQRQSAPGLYGQPSYAQSQYGQAPAHQHPPYGYAPSQYGGMPPHHNQGKGLSITSMVLGIASLVGMGFFILPQIVGIVLGHMGISREPYGRGMAIAGLIMNYLALVGFILMWVFLFAVGASIANMPEVGPSVSPSFTPSGTSTPSESFT